MRRVTALALAASAALGAAAIPVALRASVDATQTGTFALPGGTPKIVAKFWAEHGTGLSATLKVQQFLPGSDTPIRAYDLDMSKMMHEVIVRDDFATFDHLHPAFDARTGVFSTPFAKQGGHRYYVYADSEPRGIGQQVFRFTMESDGPLVHAAPSLTASPKDAAAGPYVVHFAATTIAAMSHRIMNVDITKSGAPANDLVPYLEAAGHCVLIDTKTLAYVHVHPMLRGQTPSPAMAGMSIGQQMEAMESASKAGPHLVIHLPPLPAGVYKMWFQFKGGANAQVYTAPFTMVAR